MEILIGSLNKGKSVHAKFVVVITKKGVVDFKLFRVNLNCLLVDGSSIFSAKKELVSTDFLRFFLNARDAAYFNTFVPYSKMQILSNINKEVEELTLQGRYTDALLKSAVYSMVEENRSEALNNIAILANKALFISKLAEKYDLLYQLTYIIQQGTGSQAVSWFNLELPIVDNYFDDFYKQMVASRD